MEPGPPASEASERSIRRALLTARDTSTPAAVAKARAQVDAAAAAAGTSVGPVVSIEDEVTGTGASVQRIILGISADAGGPSVLRDWELLIRLNALPLRTGVGAEADLETDSAEIEPLMTALGAQLSALVPSMYRPSAWPEVLLVPGKI